MDKQRKHIIYNRERNILYLGHIMRNSKYKTQRLVTERKIVAIGRYKIPEYVAKKTRCWFGCISTEIF